MSLRRRLLLVVLLAGVAIAAAASAIFHVLRSTDAVRVKAVERTLASSLDALADAFLAAHAPSVGGADRLLLENASRAIVTPLYETAVGFCTADGELVGEVMAGKKRGDPNLRPRPLPPDQREALSSACGVRGMRETTYVRVSHPHDVVVIAIRPVAPDGSAWALTRVPTPSADN